MDDELEMLMNQLMSVQQQKTNPLSERTVAQIMVKLHRNNFAFLPTTDGNEYVTPQRLDQQISDLVRQRHKIPVNILPQILNINIDAIQMRITHILKKQKIIKHNSYLLSQQQIKSVIASIKQQLQTEGKIDIETVAQKNQFNMVFTKKIIEQNMEELNAEMVENQLITNQYSEMQKARISGFLNSISRPLNLQTMIKTVNIEQRNLTVILDQLIKQGKILGKNQNGYYIPNKFAQNQKKIVNKFFQQNGYLQFSFLSKNFIHNKQQQWLKRNLDGKFVCFQGVCFSQLKLEQYQSQLTSLLKGEGLIEVSQVIPFELEDRNMAKFLSQYCKLNSFLYNNGYCYSQQWLQKCALQFRQKVIYNIFFKKVQQGAKKGKKKKEQSPQVTEQELIETLFDGGLAQYSVLESLSSYLLPVLNTKLEQLKVKCEKQLAQNKGIINSGFLKYKRCKSIVKNQQNLQRYLNSIEKQKKKNGKWQDPDFGPNDNDKLGQFSLIYYDGVLYKNWPSLQQLKWRSIQQEQLQMSIRHFRKSQFMKKSLLPDLINILDYNNRAFGKNVETPIVQKYSLKKQAPFAFRFFTSQKDHKFVVVDEKTPVLGQKTFGSTGLIGLIEKAYAKLRYCYKATLSVGIQQIIFELTGRTSKKILSQHNNTQKVAEILIQEMKKGAIVVFMAQGQIDKKILLNEQETGFQCCKPYTANLKDGNFQIFPESSIGKNCLTPVQTIQIFKQAYIF